MTLVMGRKRNLLGVSLKRFNQGFLTDEKGKQIAMDLTGDRDFIGHVRGLLGLCKTYCGMFRGRIKGRKKGKEMSYQGELCECSCV